MKRNYTTKIILSATIIFASIATVSAQTNNDNTGYSQPAQAQSTYQDHYMQQSDPAQQSQPIQQNQQYTQQNQPVQQSQQYTQQAAPVQQTQQPVQYANQQGYYYYPDANVYYDPTYNDYMYNNGSAWLTVNVLPYNIRLGGLPRFMVYHRGPQVWLDNGFHRANYFGYNNRFHTGPVIGYRNNYRGVVAYNRGFDRGRSFGGDRGFGGGRGFNGGRGGGFGHHH